MAELLSLAAAQAAVLERARPLATEEVPVDAVAGRIAAEDIVAVVNLPPFAASAMDGFALRVEDTPGVLPVVARIAAGVPATEPLEAGAAMGIATGGVVPDGADAVIPLEHVVDSGNEIEVRAAVVQMDNIRPAGADIRAGDVVVSRGTSLTAASVGALAAAGVAQVRCARKPRVAVLSTGTELRPPGEPLGPGQVYEANGAMLAAAFASANADVERLPFVADDEGAHRDAIERALEHDVVVTSGGVSVGPHDLVRLIEHELGVEEVFWGVAVKPGKPVSFGVRGNTLVFGLPGNPVSSLVGAELFVRPALLALQGASDPGPVYERARLHGTARRNPQRDELLRARRTIADNVVEVTPIRGQESHMIARASGADALVLIPRGDGELPAGTAVDYLRLV